MLKIGIIAHTLFDPEAGQVGRKMTEVPSPEVSFDLNAFTHYSARFGASKSLTFCSRINLRPAKNILGDLLKYRGNLLINLFLFKRHRGGRGGRTQLC